MVAVTAPRQARAIATRERVLAAAADCLGELGYYGTTTSAVAGRAGVSQGALFKHYPSKNALLAAALERVLAGFVTGFRAAASEECGASLAARVRCACDALWSIFRQPQMRAVFEIYLAARTDADLRTAIEPILANHERALHEEALALFPVHRENPEFIASVDLVVHAMQGAALGLAAPSREQIKLLGERFFALALRELQRHAQGEE